jgi:hypothetical protein
MPGELALLKKMGGPRLQPATASERVGSRLGVAGTRRRRRRRHARGDGALLGLYGLVGDGKICLRRLMIRSKTS